MSVLKPIRSILAVALATVSLSAVFVTSAAASPAMTTQELQAFAGNSANPLQARVDAQLRLSKGGVQISPNEIAWDNGRVIMSFPLDNQVNAPAPSAAALTLMSAGSPATSGVGPQTVTPLDIHGCPTVIIGKDWFCFYQDINWGGRRLQWSDDYCGFYEDFSPYGFRDQTSSWVNGGGGYVDGGNYGLFAGVVQWYAIWTEEPHSNSSYVGNALNDQADGFQSCGT